MASRRTAHPDSHQRPGEPRPPAGNLGKVESLLDVVTFRAIGTFAGHDRLTLNGDELDAKLDDLRATWLRPLDW